MHRSRVDAFRHRAALIITDHTAVSHVYHSLTLPLALKTRAGPQTSSAKDYGRCSGARGTP